MARVARDFSLEKITCLDAPRFRPQEIVRQFWAGLERYDARLVTFNGRSFDLPLLELAACRYGCSGLKYFQRSRNRYNGGIDLLDWFTNYGAFRLTGGLNLLAKLLGLPGKTNVAGDQVYAMYCEGQISGDQRLLPVRYAGHLLRVSPHSSIDRRDYAGAGSRFDRAGSRSFAGAGERDAGTGPLFGELGRLPAVAVIGVSR